MAEPGRPKRESVEIVADAVQFLGGRDDAAWAPAPATASRPHSDVPADTSDFAPQPVGARSSAPADDDIPF